MKKLRKEEVPPETAVLFFYNLGAKVKHRDDKGFYVFEGKQTWVPVSSTGMTELFMFLKKCKTWGARVKTWDDKGRI